jgi:hypothetical protein
MLLFLGFDELLLVECRETESRAVDLGGLGGNLHTPQNEESEKTSEALKTDKQKKAATDVPAPKHKQAFGELLDLSVKPRRN